jgi:metal-sulfur cluster biosynthetic enzyme
MMVLRRGGVEGSAKIAMTPLLSGCPAMGLLPNDVPPGLIFPSTDVAQIC